MLKLPSVQIIFVYNINNIFCAHSDPEILGSLRSQPEDLFTPMVASNVRQRPTPPVRNPSSKLYDRRAKREIGLGSILSLLAPFASPFRFVSFRFARSTLLPFIPRQPLLVTCHEIFVSQMLRYREPGQRRLLVPAQRDAARVFRKNDQIFPGTTCYPD